MPYIVVSPVRHNGELRDVSTILSDADGNALLANHSASLTRVPHHDDRCHLMVGGCDHPMHRWNADDAGFAPEPDTRVPRVTVTQVGGN